MKKPKSLTKIILIVVPILIFIFFLSSRFMNISIKNEHISKEQWREDIDYIQTNLPKKHKNLFCNETKEQFYASIKKLHDNVDFLNSSEIQVELMKIVASIGDAHTKIFNFKSNDMLPLKFYWFKDGIYIISCDSEYENLLGYKVEKINNVPINDYISNISVLIPHNNEYLIKQDFSDYVEDIKVLEHFGCVKNNAVSLTLADKNGNKVTESVKIKKSAEIKYVSISDKLKNKPLYLQNNDTALWSKYLKEEELVYCKLNSCPSVLNVKEINNIKNIANGNKVKTIVLDIRNNEGGTYFDNNQLYNMIKQLKTSNKIENVDIILGRQTFSSGILYALEFKNKLGAKTYGEPTGGSPNGYGDVRKMVLPNSKLNIMYSTKYFDSNISGNTLRPDYEVELSMKDYTTGVDPVLQEIINQNVAYY